VSGKSKARLRREALMEYRIRINIIVIAAVVALVVVVALAGGILALLDGIGPMVIDQKILGYLLPIGGILAVAGLILLADYRERLKEIEEASG